MNKAKDFIDKHIATNYANASEREETIIRTAFDLGVSFASKDKWISIKKFPYLINTGDTEYLCFSDGKQAVGVISKEISSFNCIYKHSREVKLKNITHFQIPPNHPKQ